MAACLDKIYSQKKRATEVALQYDLEERQDNKTTDYTNKIM